MDSLKKYFGLIVIITLLLSRFLDNSNLLFYISAFIILSGIYKSADDLFQSGKKKIVNAIVVDCITLYENITDDNVNFLLTLKLILPDSDNPTIKVKGLLFKKLNAGDKTKVIVNEKNIEQSKIFTGNEAVSSWIQIVVLTVFLIFLIYWKIHS
jgi:hypothetical protein